MTLQQVGAGASPVQAGTSPGEAHVGIIDVGSNSIRLVVYRAGSRVPQLVFNEKVLCGLGRNLGQTGQLDPEGVERAHQNLDRFTWLCQRMRLERLDIIATAAVREASDGPAFIAETERRTGVKVWVVDGAEEARFAAMGVLCGIPSARGLVGDLGGGSLELVAVSGGATKESCTLPLGPLRLAEVLSRSPDEARRFVDEALDTVDWLERQAGNSLYAVGGAWRALARMHMSDTGYPLHIIHQFSMPRADATRLLERLVATAPEELNKRYDVSRRRLETVPAAAIVMERLLERQRADRLVFSAYGLREGVYYDGLSPTEQRRDPLLAYCEVLTNRQPRFGLQPRELFDWLSPIFADESAADQRLRLAACNLADIAWIEHPDYRGEHAMLHVMRMPAPAVEHAERAYLGLVMANRHKGGIRSRIHAEARDMLPAERVIEAQRVGQALRLAFTLSGGTPNVLSEFELGRDGKRVFLRVPSRLAPEVGEAVVRRLTSLASSFQLDHQVVMLPHAL